MKKTFLLALLFGASILSSVIVHAAEEYEFVTMWPKLDQPWYFKTPEGIAVDAAGNVYVVDCGNRCIKKFSSDGELITRWGDAGGKGREMGEIRGIAVADLETVYVTAENNIYKFTSKGEFVAKWTMEGGAVEKDYAAADGVAVDSLGNVYATDVELQMFEADVVDRYADFFADADVLIFDSQYTLEETVIKEDWGHSNNVIGIELSQEAGVKHLVLFHQDPTVRDEALDKLLKDSRKLASLLHKGGSIEVSVARDGMVIEV